MITLRLRPRFYRPPKSLNTDEILPTAVLVYRRCHWQQRAEQPAADSSSSSSGADASGGVCRLVPFNEASRTSPQIKAVFRSRFRCCLSHRFVLKLPPSMIDYRCSCRSFASVIDVRGLIWPLPLFSHRPLFVVAFGHLFSGAFDRFVAHTAGCHNSERLEV